MRCGCDDMSVTFLFSGTQIAKEAFLEVMSSILSTDEVLDGPVGPEFERISCDVPNNNFVDSVTLIEAPSEESLAQVCSRLANNGDKIVARFGDCVKTAMAKTSRRGSPASHAGPRRGVQLRSRRSPPREEGCPQY